MSKNFSPEDEYGVGIELALAGLVGFSSIVVVQLLSLDKLDVPLTITLYSCAFSLPFLILHIINISEFKRRGHSIIPDYQFVALILALISAFVGIVALFWHFSWLIGSLFTLSSVVAFVMQWHTNLRNN